MKKENKNIENKIEKNIEEREQGLADEIEAKIDKELDQEIESDIKEVVSRDVKEKIKEKVEEKLAERGLDTGGVEGQSGLRRSIAKYRHELAICWSGTCKHIAIVAIMAYLIIGGLIVSCAYFDLGFCLERSFTGGAPYVAVVTVVSLAVSFSMALLSSQPRIAFIFIMILAVPMLFLFLAMAVQYVGAIIAGAIILYFVFQFFTRR